MQTFFTSDIHESHKNIVSLSNRKRVVVQEQHSEWLVEIWNKQAINGDSKVYHFGDFSFTKKYDHVAKFTAQLKGQKFLIKGNHDRTEILDRLVKDGLIQAWYDYKEIYIGENKVVMFHYPIASWNKQGHGSWHLHGHCHGSYNTKGKILDVGLDSAYNILGEHRMFTEQDIEQHMFKRLVSTVDHHSVKGE